MWGQRNFAYKCCVQQQKKTMKEKWFAKAFKNKYFEGPKSQKKNKSASIYIVNVKR